MFILLALQDVPPELVPLFASRFARFVPRQGFLLPLDELAAVLTRDDRADFCIGGTVVRAASLVSLARGDLSVLTVPLSDFARGARGVVPDPDDFTVTDHGRTLRFGEYEAAFDAVLYERDAPYRRKLKAAREAEDQSLGASLRRLRKQRGLRLEDLGKLAKTAARIERGEVSQPRPATLAALASRLDVQAARIREF